MPKAPVRTPAVYLRDVTMRESSDTALVSPYSILSLASNGKAKNKSNVTVALRILILCLIFYLVVQFIELIYEALEGVLREVFLYEV